MSVIDLGHPDVSRNHCPSVHQTNGPEYQLTPVSITAILMPFPVIPASLNLFTCVIRCGEKLLVTLPPSWRLTRAAASSPVERTSCCGIGYRRTGKIRLMVGSLATLAAISSAFLVSLN